MMLIFYQMGNFPEFKESSLTVDTLNSVFKNHVYLLTNCRFGSAPDRWLNRSRLCSGMFVFKVILLKL